MAKSQSPGGAYENPRYIDTAGSIRAATKMIKETGEDAAEFVGKWGEAKSKGTGVYEKKEEKPEIGKMETRGEGFIGQKSEMPSLRVDKGDQIPIVGETGSMPRSPLQKDATDNAANINMAKMVGWWGDKSSPLIGGSKGKTTSSPDESSAYVAPGNLGNRKKYYDK